MSERHIFAVSDLDTSKKFIKRCKSKSLVASSVLAKLMRLFNEGKVDEVIYPYGNEKSRDGLESGKEKRE